MIEYVLLLGMATRRSGGMADASDSKSDVGDYVWVQVPSPACNTKRVGR